MTVEIHFILLVVNGNTYMNTYTNSKIFISTHILVSISLVYVQI